MRCAATLALLLAACDAQVDAGYGGEPLVVLAGAIAAPAASSVQQVVLRWSTADPLGPGRFQSPTTLRISFPSGFEADVLAEPPAGARLALAAGEPRFAEAYVFALDRDGRTVGADFVHVLVWLEGDARPGGPTAAYLGAGLAAGFHVMVRAALPAPPASQQPLVATCVAEALRLGWDDTRARATCDALHGYQLAPSPSGLDEPWLVHVGGPP